MQTWKLPGVIAVAAVVIAACGSPTGEAPATAEADPLLQGSDALLDGEVMAIAYSGFREGQHPDRGDGAVNPSDEEILEDLEILVAHGFKLIRVYDTGENTVATLRLIREHEMPIKVLLGIWLRAEISNHEGCPKLPFGQLSY